MCIRGTPCKVLHLFRRYTHKKKDTHTHTVGPASSRGFVSSVDELGFRTTCCDKAWRAMLRQDVNPVWKSSKRCATSGRKSCCAFRTINPPTPADSRGSASEKQLHAASRTRSKCQSADARVNMISKFMFSKFKKGKEKQSSCTSKEQASKKQKKKKKIKQLHAASRTRSKCQSTVAKART